MPIPVRAIRARAARPVALLAATLIVACSPAPRETRVPSVSRAVGVSYAVRDTVIATTFEAAGVAAPLRQAMLSTKLMGTVTEVLVNEGDVVAAGQLLARIDARELTAREAQVAASVAEAAAVQRDAATQAARMRALYADSAASRSQLDAAEMGLARADAGARAARAAADEVRAVRSYSEIRAPFAGIVTKRFADPGTFATPGAPLVAVQDASQLRITAGATPDMAARLRRGESVAATIEGRQVRATIEGVVPAASGNLYTVNALVANAGAPLLAGSAASLAIPTGRRTVVVVPTAAVVREGDLTGVMLRAASGDETRWVRLGRETNGLVEVNAGLRSGNVIVVPSPREVRVGIAAAGGGN